MQTGCFGGGALHYFLDQQASGGGKFECLRYVAGYVHGGDAQARWFPAGAEIVEHGFGAIDRHCGIRCPTLPLSVSP